MKIKFFAGLLASLLATVALGQTYSIFSPGPSGPVKSNGTYALQSEVSADIIGLWTGTCSATTFLKGAGACGQVVLTTDVSGILPVPNGGLGVGAITGLVLGNGTSPVSAYGGNGCTNQFIRSLSSAGVATCNTVSLTADVTNTLPATNGGTSFNTFTLGDMLYSSAANTLAKLAGNTTSAKQFLTQTGTGAVSAAPVWGAIASTDLPGSFSGFANPTASIGLTAVNGAATTAMRSDAAPPLSQAISPTWTAAHTFSLAGSLSTQPVNLNSSFPYLGFRNTSGAADSKEWAWRANTTQMDLVTIDDAGTAAKTALSVVRSANAINAVNVGNTTDNPPVNFQGTGAATFSGGVVLGAATGGNKGVGTVNTASTVFTNNAPIYPTINCSAGGPCAIASIAVGQTAYVAAAAQQDQASTTTLINDTELQFTGAPIGLYQGTIVIFTTGSGTGGIKWAFPAASTYSLAGAQFCGSNTLVFQSTATITCAGIPGGFSITGQWNVTVSGTLALQWAQNASNVTNTSRFATSAWTITRIK